METTLREIDALLEDLRRIHRNRCLGRFFLLAHVARTERARVARHIRLGRLVLLCAVTRNFTETPTARSFT